MNIQTIYRIENQLTNHGMWYNNDGQYDPFILTLTEGKSTHLPMEFDARYGNNNVRWYSGCLSLELLSTWFSVKDVLELHEAGYKLYEFTAREYINEQFQTLFTRRGILEQKELDFTNEMFKF